MTTADTSSSSPLQQAFQLFAAGRLADAAQRCASVLAEQPDQPDALYLSGEIARHGGQFALAEHYLRRALCLRPDAVFYHASMAHLLRDQQLWTRAIAHYLAALARVAAVAPLYQALVAMGATAPLTELDPAIQSASAAANTLDQAQGAALSATFSATLATQLGIAYQQSGHLEAAVLCLRDALAHQPASADAHFNLGVAYAAQGRWDAAQHSYREALALQPDYVAAHCNLGAVLKALDQPDAALTCYQNALRYAPAHAATLFNLGLLHADAQRPEAARAAYEQALQADPSMVAAHINLAELLEHSGARESAQHHRDIAYRAQNVFIDEAPGAVRTILLLLDARSGNLPYPSLLDPQRNRIIKWVIGYGDTAQIDRLPPYDLVFNAIGDADADAATAPLLIEFTDHCGKPLLNRPVAVAATARDRLAALLAGLADVQVAATRRVKRGGDWQRAPDLPYPILLRPPGSHGGEGVARADDPAELARLAIQGDADLYLSAFHDYRSADGYFRKYRAIFVDRQPYPYHLAIGTHWMVHYATAQMTEYRWKLEEERRFLEQPDIALGTRGMAALRAIGARLDLDYAGVDFSILPNGSVLVFEANATMLAHRETEPVLRFKNTHVQAIFDAFEAMLAGRCGAV